MYQLSYNQQILSYTSIDEIITSLHHLHTQCKNNLEQLLVILQWNGPIHLELGLGKSNDCLFLLTIPKSSLDDCKITYNPLEDIDSANNIHFKGNDFIFSCSNYNMIPLNSALEEIRYILSHNIPSNNLKWYSH